MALSDQSRLSSLRLNRREHGADCGSLRSELPVAGFAVIEAADLSEAVRIASRTPCAVAFGVVEVWPLEHPA